MRRSAYYSRNGSYSRSYNAERAENEGRLPLTRAAKVVAAKFGCSQVVARRALEFIGSTEWHHVGKFANRVDYYDTDDYRLAGVVREVQKVGAKRWPDHLRALQQQRRQRWVYVPTPGVVLRKQEAKRRKKCE